MDACLVPGAIVVLLTFQLFEAMISKAFGVIKYIFFLNLNDKFKK